MKGFLVMSSVIILRRCQKTKELLFRLFTSRHNFGFQQTGGLAVLFHCARSISSRQRCLPFGCCNGRSVFHFEYREIHFRLPFFLPLALVSPDGGNCSV